MRLLLQIIFVSATITLLQCCRHQQQTIQNHVELPEHLIAALVLVAMLGALAPLTQVCTIEGCSDSVQACVTARNLCTEVTS